MAVTLALCSYKGGTGKTTLAYNLAERATRSGCSVSLLDFDPQEGSVGLASLRMEDTPWEVRVGQASNSGAESLSSFRDQSASDLIVCDMPSWDSMAMAKLLSQADLVLCPVGVGPSDLLAAANFQWMAGQVRLDVWYVPNLLPFGRSRREQLVRELVSFTPPASVVPVSLMRRVAHLDSLRRGLGVCEYAPHSRGALEVMALWEWINARLELPCG